MIRQQKSKQQLSSIERRFVPNPFDSFEQRERYYHFDIPYLETAELRKELHALCPHLWELPDDHWMHQRVDMLQHELAKRRQERLR